MSKAYHLYRVGNEWFLPIVWHSMYHWCHYLQLTKSMYQVSDAEVLWIKVGTITHARIPRSGDRDPLENHKNIRGFLSKTGLDPMNTQSYKLVFNVGPSSARPQGAH